MKIFALTVLVLLPALLLAGLTRSVYRRGALMEIVSWWRGASRSIKVASILFATVAICYGGNKFLAGVIDLAMKKAGRFVGSVVTNLFSPDELATHYAVSSVKSGETFDFTMPEGAKLADRIAKRGAHDDGFWLFDSFTNEIFRADLFPENHIWVHTDGSLTLNSRSHNIPIGRMADELMISNVTVYAPMQGPFGFLPNYRWEQYGISRIWTKVTDYGSRLITFEGALPNCDPDAMLSFQTEFRQGGDIVYRYSGMPTNKVSVGILYNGTALMPDVATNTTSVTLKYIGDLSDGAGDTDGDGLTDWQEVKVYGTDPRLADTDCDGVPDGVEIDSGTAPSNPDSDGDGVPDGWTRERYDAHRLFNGEDSDHMVMVTLAESTSVSNRAVLKIGDMPLLLTETNSWTFSMPTGTVWNFELRTAGTPVMLELTADDGIFVSDEGRVFASQSPRSTERRMMMRGAKGAGPNRGAGSAGGSGQIAHPVIGIWPPNHVVHGNTASLRLARIPFLPARSADVTWWCEDGTLGIYSVETNDSTHVTVSKLLPELSYRESVTVHATVSNAFGSRDFSATALFCEGQVKIGNSATFEEPHTNASFNITFLSCEHHGEKSMFTPEYILEVEAGRTTYAGWQHLAWIDTGAGIPGTHGRSFVSNGLPRRIEWDMKARRGQSLAYGPDSISYGTMADFERMLPAIQSREYVPPPFVDIRTRLFRKTGNNTVLFSEDLKRISIPQYVQITWDNAALDEFRKELKFIYSLNDPDCPPPTNVTLLAACSSAEAESAFQQIPAKIQAMLPGGANIKVVGKDADIPQRHKTVTIHHGWYRISDTGACTTWLGATPITSCHQLNSSPEGESGVYLKSVRGYLENQYGEFHIQYHDEILEDKYDLREVSTPLSQSSVADVIAQVAMHEFAHSAGLVPDGFDYLNGHNHCTCGRHYMDSGNFRTLRWRLIAERPLGWNHLNTNYLNKVFGLPRRY